jgi:hypothetical protein
MEVLSCAIQNQILERKDMKYWELFYIVIFQN